jgi:hypothetical protein
VDEDTQHGRAAAGRRSVACWLLRVRGGSWLAVTEEWEAEQDGEADSEGWLDEETPRGFAFESAPAGAIARRTPREKLVKSGRVRG